MMELTQPLWFTDNLVRIHVDADDSGGSLTVTECRGRQGAMPPLHVHHRDDEAFYVIDGEMTLFVGDRQLVLGAGQAALAPHETPHSYRVESGEARWLVINTPAGFDSFVRATAEPAPADELPAADRPLDAAALAREAAKVGIEILGPPGALP